MFTKNFSILPDSLISISKKIMTEASNEAPNIQRLTLTQEENDLATSQENAREAMKVAHNAPGRAAKAIEDLHGKMDMNRRGVRSHLASTMVSLNKAENETDPEKRRIHVANARDSYERAHQALGHTGDKPYKEQLDSDVDSAHESMKVAHNAPERAEKSLQDLHDRIDVSQHGKQGTVIKSHLASAIDSMQRAQKSNTDKEKMERIDQARDTHLKAHRILTGSGMNEESLDEQSSARMSAYMRGAKEQFPNATTRKIAPDGSHATQPSIKYPTRSMSRREVNRNKGLYLAHSKIMGNARVNASDYRDTGTYVFGGSGKKNEESITESRKKVGEYTNGKLTTRVYALSGQDNEGDPYHVKLYKNGKHHEPSDYFTNDLKDAHGTAKEMVQESQFNEARQRIPLDGHPYHNKSDAQLRFIIRDAGEAANAMRDVNPAAESKYLDQINDASTVLAYREKMKLRESDELSAKARALAAMQRARALQQTSEKKSKSKSKNESSYDPSIKNKKRKILLEPEDLKEVPVETNAGDKYIRKMYDESSHLSAEERKKKEEVVLGMKKEGGIEAMKKKFGDRWKEVLSATATKIAKNAKKKKMKEEPTNQPDEIIIEPEMNLRGSDGVQSTKV